LWWEVVCPVGVVGDVELVLAGVEGRSCGVAQAEILGVAGCLELGVRVGWASGAGEGEGDVGGGVDGEGVDVGCPRLFEVVGSW
jgi:hypothetical protein